MLATIVARTRAGGPSHDSAPTPRSSRAHRDQDRGVEPDWSDPTYSEDVTQPGQVAPTHKNCSTACHTALLDRAPTTDATALPSRNRIIVGAPRMLKSRTVTGLTSMSSLTTVSWS